MMHHSASRLAMRSLGIVGVVVAMAAAPAVPTAAGRALPAASARDVPDGYTLFVKGARLEKDRGPLETWTATVTLEPREVERTGRGAIAEAFYWARSGTVRWTVSSGGDCPWKKSFTLRVRPGNDAEIRFSGSGYAAGIAAQVGSVNVVAKEKDVTEAGTVCRDVTLRVSPGGEWLEMDDFAKGGFGAVLKGAESSPTFPRDGHRFEWVLAPRSSEAGLHAVAKGDSVQRGRIAQVDGSGSSPKARIESYRWTYTLGHGCPKGARPAEGAGGRGSMQAFVALCTVHALLTVRDSKGRQAMDNAVVQVRPRRGELWRTPMELDIVNNVRLPFFDPPARDRLLIAGALRCRNGYETRVFCRGSTPLNSFYEIAGPVQDRGGPFDGWYYVHGSVLKVEKIIFLNPFMEPNAPPAATGQPNWYRYNETTPDSDGQPIDVATQRAHTIAHEGVGFGPRFRRSGHMQAIYDGIRGNDLHNDPRRYLETRIGPVKAALQAKADRCLETIDDATKRYADDPLSTSPLILSRMWVWARGMVFDGWEEADLSTSEPGPPVEVPVVTCVDEP